MRVILVPVADRPECAVALERAFDLAGQLDANVVGCHVRPSREEAAGGLIADGAYPWRDAEGEIELNSRAASALFHRVADARGFAIAKGPRLGQSGLATWHSMVGTPSLIMQIAGPVADLVVLSRPKPKSTGPGRAFVLAGLLHSGRPALVVPQRPVRSIGNCAVIAWNQGFECAAAVKSAMPLLQRAQRVVIVSAGAERAAGPRATALARYLKYWGVTAERVATKGRRPETEIEDAFRKVGGDLLVMGCYSRPRLSELIFGGVTERMLFHTDIPVLCQHR